MARIRLAAAAFAATLGWAAAGLAQDVKPEDKALDNLLQKLEGKPESKPGEAPPAAKPKDKEKPKADAPKPKKEVEAKDKALDSLLEKLGETKETPTTEGKPESKPGDGDTPPAGAKPDDAVGQKLDERQKKTDEELERLTGRTTKKDREKQKQQSEKDDNSPLGQTVKKIREVEEKLGQPDTGEQTRKKQGEIVKDFDTLIAEAKKSAQGKGKPGRRQRPGDPNGQPGNQPGTDGNTAQGANPMAPKKIKDLPAMVGSKDIWGNLPEMLRDTMENTFQAKPLPKREKQIGRYYEALSKKSLSRGQ